MRRAVEEARKGVGQTSPNPAVGAIVVRNGKLVGRGYHHRAGEAHAEVLALEDAGRLARGADLYSTLEPCDHQGRTPPCTRAILAAGIARVFVGSDDPNPLVSGAGVRRLRRAGVRVERGIARETCDALNTAWFRFITSGRPYVTLKAAITADGKLASGSGDSRWITGPKARARGHLLRAEADAVLVGARTVVRDDPRLTARLARRPSPIRLVLDGGLSTKPTHRVYSRSSPGAVLITASGQPGRTAAFERRGVGVVALEGKGRRLPLGLVLRTLAKRGIVSLLVEGGADLHGQFIRSGLWDRLVLFVAPKLLGSRALPWLDLLGGERMDEAIPLGSFTAEAIGGDAVLEIRRDGLS
jgi:diaminohydroxyphosphoribosylaminopyrimidine deaminase/5-amino-6-(5-phosphoribosylamino)uracil reductase